MAHGWLEWVARKKVENICPIKNRSEVHLGERALPVDRFGVPTSTVYQFHGCFWHEYSRAKIAGVVNHPHTGKAIEELYQKTLKTNTYVSSLGNRLVVMWECQ